MTADDEDSLLRSVAQQNVESIRAVRLRAEQQAEATLREQASLLNLTHDAIFVRDMNGTVKYWNRGAEELYGWPAEQAVGRVSQELLNTMFPVPFEQIEEELIGAGRWEGELVQTKQDGSQVAVASRWSLQRDERSAPVAILVINNDITKRKRAEEAARRSEKELRDVVNAVPAFVWSTLPDGAVDFVNERWQEQTGIPPEGALGWNWEAVVHPEDRAGFVEHWRKAVKSGQAMEHEVRVQRATGEYRWLFVRNVPLRDKKGNIVKWYGTSFDIEDRKRAEEERERLRQLQADLAHVNRVSTLGELTASIAHELKQPIAAAITNAKTSLRWLAREEPDLQEAREAILRAVNDNTRGAEIIDRLRSFYKKGSPPEQEWVDVNELACEMIGLLRSEAARFSISMSTELIADLPKAKADRVQLQQVFMNLMLNAIEAMKDTSGELTIKSERNDDGQLLISIRDTGVGLPPEKIDQIFSAFYTTKAQGTGMGLAISRTIIESHGGRLWANGNTGAGATFQFTLPCEAALSSHSAA
jgi:PAS domain S-box-containing protein